MLQGSTAAIVLGPGWVWVLDHPAGNSYRMVFQKETYAAILRKSTNTKGSEVWVPLVCLPTPLYSEPSGGYSRLPNYKHFESALRGAEKAVLNNIKQYVEIWRPDGNKAN